MKPIEIDTAGANALDMIPESCGDVTVGCTDVAGIVEAVLKSSETLREEHNSLRDTVVALEADQHKVAEASDEARLLSERAIERLGEGTTLIHSSLGQINDVLELVEALAQHVTSFAAAMEQVRRCSKDIEDIAETTNILALNATIEAMRAGEAGRTFAVVAGEVKSLANDTRKATEEITATVDALGGEAQQVIERIEAGSAASGNAKTSVAQIESTILSVGELVEEVDKQNDQIARSTTTISDHVVRVSDVLDSFDEAATDNEAKLANAHSRMEELELTASEMFDRIVHAGLSPEDSLMVEQAQGYARELAEFTEQAIVLNKVDKVALFDRNYQEIAGSNPPRFNTSGTAWIHEHWRPFLDKAQTSDSRLLAAACTDVNGFLPTHLSARSQEPTGNLAHDTAFCRNGRIIFEGVDKKAKMSTAPYTMAVYRQEGDGEKYIVVRNVYVPLYINGERWGDYELAYSFD
ncbi:MAG: chemotaxis protein [Altererythrobacter sp.]|nr:chemotaxis protein [Altererythrobacter sp.]NNE50505.1 chemotaxis protein [Altererythrobacter sp.]NNF93628.1 chemotaxis protein [Altererythrobacter sp.]NNK46175.1 chemotaxis protein [Altererythrobacter sp.]